MMPYTLPRYYLTTDGASLAYDVVGQGPPIILVHGFTLNHNVWAPQIGPLAETYQLLIYDLRGHGQSGSQSRDYSRLRMLSDLTELLQHVGVSRAIVCGQSMGASLAAEFALANPSVVETLVLVSPYISGFPRPAESIWNSVGMPFDELARSRGIAAAKSRWEQFALFESARRIPEVRAVLSDMIATFSGAPWIYGADGKRVHPSTMERITELVCPVLLVCGECDDVLYRSVAAHMAGALRQAELKAIPAAPSVPTLMRQFSWS